MEKRNLKINNLKLWDENPRFPEEYFKKTEKELISYLFKKEKNRMLDLAKSISENFDLIPIEKLVIWKSEAGLIVLEGNRRLAIYKLLNSPKLSSDPQILSFFEEKSKQIKISNDFEIECIITDDKEEGLKYVALKHLEKGYSNWQESERINFQKRRGISVSEKEIVKHEMNKIVKNLNLPKELIEGVLGPGKLTTFYRVIASTPAKKYFNYEILEDTLKINDIDFESKLKIIIWQIFNEKDSSGNPLNSRSLNTNEEIEKYLNGLNLPKEVKSTEDAIINSYKDQVNVFGQKSKEFIIPNKQKKSPILLPADKLFGRTLCLKQGKVNNLYCAIDKIYEQNKYNDKNLEIVLPIIGMSLRLILDVASREYYNGKIESNEDALYKKFVNEIKSEYKKENKSEALNFTAFNDLFNVNFEGYLGKYAHGNIIYDKQSILKVSKIVGDILEKTFGIKK